MPLLSNKSGYRPRIELKSRKCIDTVLQPLSDHVTIKINGSLTSEDIFHTAVSMASTGIQFTLLQHSTRTLLAKHLYDSTLRN